ncbi:MAG: S8 family serine peptidase, partial [Pirellulales bacterium]|nr:S8 family serine peptidase [Pirellulales bacterium]
MMKRFYEFGQRRVARLKDRQRVARRAGLRVERLEARQLLAGDLLVGDFHPDQFLVRFTDAAAAESHLEGTKLGDQLGFGFYEVYLDSGVGLDQAMNHYNQLPGVDYAQRDFVLQHGSTTPDDAYFDSLWGLHNTGQTNGTVDADIDAVEAWDVETDASSIIVAVIDTGIDYTHEDLAGNAWVNTSEANGTPGVDDDGNGYTDDIYGYDFYNEDGDPFDDNGHGTHVSGTIGAVGNNGTGVTGVSWEVQLMGLKFLNESG